MYRVATASGRRRGSISALLRYLCGVLAPLVVCISCTRTPAGAPVATAAASRLPRVAGHFVPSSPRCPRPMWRFRVGDTATPERFDVRSDDARSRVFLRLHDWHCAYHTSPPGHHITIACGTGSTVVSYAATCGQAPLSLAVFQTAPGGEVAIVHAVCTCGT